MEMPIYVKLAALYDNYVTSPGTVEDHTEEEQVEEMALIQVNKGRRSEQFTNIFPGNGWHSCNEDNLSIPCGER